MDGIFYTGTAISGLLYFVVGTRLLRMGLRTGETPEYLLGAVFLLWSLYYYLDILPYLLVEESMFTPIFFSTRVVAALATVLFALFTRNVFRKEESWARWLIAGMAICLIAGIGGSIAVGDPGGVAPLFNPWYWVEVLGNAVPFVWMAAESFAQHRMAKRRLRLNLCDPIVCNCYLLWGIASVLLLAVEVVASAQIIEFEVTQQLTAPMDILLMTTEFCTVGVVWLVFFPPNRYRRWIRGAAPVASTDTG